MADLPQTEDQLFATMSNSSASNRCLMAQPLQNSLSQLLKRPDFAGRKKKKITDEESEYEYENENLGIHI